MNSKQLARVSALLDEAVEAMETTRMTDKIWLTFPIAKIREAQGILLGERPTHPEEN